MKSRRILFLEEQLAARDAELAAFRAQSLSSLCAALSESHVLMHEELKAKTCTIENVLATLELPIEGGPLAEEFCNEIIACAILTLRRGLEFQAMTAFTSQSEAA